MYKLKGGQLFFNKDNNKDRIKIGIFVVASLLQLLGWSALVRRLAREKSIEACTRLRDRGRGVPKRVIAEGWTAQKQKHNGVYMYTPRFMCRYYSIEREGGGEFNILWDRKWTRKKKQKWRSCGWLRVDTQSPGN